MDLNVAATSYRRSSYPARPGLPYTHSQRARVRVRRRRTLASPRLASPRLAGFLRDVDRVSFFRPLGVPPRPRADDAEIAQPRHPRGPSREHGRGPPPRPPQRGRDRPRRVRRPPRDAPGGGFGPAQGRRGHEQARGVQGDVLDDAPVVRARLRVRHAPVQRFRVAVEDAPRLLGRDHRPRAAAEDARAERRPHERGDRGATSDARAVRRARRRAPRPERLPGCPRVSRGAEQNVVGRARAVVRARGHLRRHQGRQRLVHEHRQAGRHGHRRGVAPGRGGGGVRGEGRHGRRRHGEGRRGCFVGQRTPRCFEG